MQLHLLYESKYYFHQYFFKKRIIKMKIKVSILNKVKY
jgi:hypothetical protein